MSQQEHDISEYSFRNFTVAEVQDGEVQSYEFKDLGEIVPKLAKRDGKKAKFERMSAERSNFSISPIVKEHRGLIEQEQAERDRKIIGEVSRRVEIIKEDAFKEGFEEGVRAGKLDVYNQTKVETEEKLSRLGEMINEVLCAKETIITKQKEEIYQLIRSLTKWVILRELKEDGEYLKRLLEKLIVETQSKSNLLIQVNSSQFESMPEVLETVQENLGKIQNVRVEVDHDVSPNGIIVDSDNGIIKGTLDQQFQNLDKLFESVGLKSGDEEVPSGE